MIKRNTSSYPKGIKEITMLLPETSVLEKAVTGLSPIEQVNNNIKKLNEANEKGYNDGLNDQKNNPYLLDSLWALGYDAGYALGQVERKVIHDTPCKKGD